jgi:hypothetical protein
MARKFLVSIDLNKNELQNAVIQNLATAPSTLTAVAGQIYYDTVDSELYFYNGAAWESTQANAQVSNGLFANRPAAGEEGRLFYATDQAILYFDDGTNWTQINGFGSVTAQTTYGGTSGNGSALTYSRSDHTHGTPSLTNNAPSTQAIGDSAVTGTGTEPARDDHKHAMPAFGSVTAQTSFGASSGDGSGTSIARNDHTHGTPTHDNTAHSAINLSALAVPLVDVSFNSVKITNLATPTASTDAATKGYVDATAQGLDVKDSVRAATIANGTLASAFENGDVIDGVTLATNDRILIKNQTDQTANGIYIVQASGAPLRSADMDAGADFPGAFTFVEEGTVNADSGFVCTTNSPVTLGSTNITWTQFSGTGTFTASAGVVLTGNDFQGVVESGKGLTVGALGFALDTAVAVRKFASDVGDGVATSYVLTHNLGTRDIIVSVYDNSSPYAEVVADVQHTTTNTATVLFSVAPTSNQYRVVVHA